MLEEQRGQQGGDVQAVGVRVGQDHHLAVAQATDVVLAGIAADGDGQVVHFFGGQDRGAGHFPGVEDLAAQRQDGLEILVACLLGAAAGRVAFHQEQFGARQVLADAVGQLAGQSWALRDLLAYDLLFSLQTRAGTFDRQLRNTFAKIGVLVQPQRERIVRGTLDETGGLA